MQVAGKLYWVCNYVILFKFRMVKLYVKKNLFRAPAFSPSALSLVQRALMVKVSLFALFTYRHCLFFGSGSSIFLSDCKVVCYTYLLPKRFE